jgi:hypothetical protein
MHFLKVVIQMLGCVFGIFYNNIKACVVCKKSHARIYIVNDIVYIKKSRDPRIEPGGTPALIDDQLEEQLAYTTRCLRSER